MSRRRLKDAQIPKEKHRDFLSIVANIIISNREQHLAYISGEVEKLAFLFIKPAIKSLHGHQKSFNGSLLNSASILISGINIEYINNTKVVKFDFYCANNFLGTPRNNQIYTMAFVLNEYGYY